MRRAILSLVLAVAFVAGLVVGIFAQDKPNFAGKWKAAGSFTTWSITVEGARMTVTQTVAGNQETTVYMLDGTPSRKLMEGPNGTIENVLTSTWDGSVLVTTITAPGMERIERRSLEADGTMKVQSIFVTMQGKPAPPPPPGAAAGMVFRRIE